MIRYIEGDLFQSPALTLVNAVNTVGVMGKGIALEFKKRYPAVFEKYQLECEKHTFSIGRLMLFYEEDHWILLFPTKEHWRTSSSLEYIEKGLIQFVKTFNDQGITSIAFPRLGCGNGELNWEDVRPVMEKHLSLLPIDVFIYNHPKKQGAPEHKMQSSFSAWLKKNAKDLSFNGLEDEIRYNYSIVPFEFTAREIQWSVQWNNGLTFSSANKEVNVGTDDFYRIWSEIRTNGIIDKNEKKESRTLVCEVLTNLGYLSRIHIGGNEGGRLIEGYQVNEGLGRSFAINGIAV